MSMESRFVTVEMEMSAEGKAVRRGMDAEKRCWK